MAEDKAAFEYLMPVRFADTDAQGHVYFANYLTYCDEALYAYFRHIGFDWKDMLALGVDMFYRQASCEYRRGARFEETVHIAPRVAAIGNSSVRCCFEMRAGDGGVIGTAELTIVCVDIKNRKPTRVPDQLREAVGG